MEEEKALSFPPLPDPFREPAFEVTGQKVGVHYDDIPMIPKGARILVLQNDFVQHGRIIIPDKAQAKPTTGKVVAIGPLVPDDFVKLGEMVVFNHYAGVPIVIVTGEGNVTTFLSLSPDEIAGELIVDPERLQK